MANNTSSKKRLRQNVKARARNRWRKARIKNAVDTYTEALEAGDKAKAGELLKDVYKQLDQVAAKGAIHKKTADRRKSRLAAKLAAL